MTVLNNEQKPKKKWIYYKKIQTVMTVTYRKKPFLSRIMNNVKLHDKTILIHCKCQNLF